RPAGRDLRPQRLRDRLSPREPARAPVGIGGQASASPTRLVTGAPYGLCRSDNAGNAQMPPKIATWNINSVRLRLPLVVRLLEEHRPDVLCLQETKCPDDQFPTAAFRKLGYPYVEIHGQRGYHGVATISRLPLEVVERRGF